MPKLIKGSELNEAQRKQVKAAFVYRLTTENGYPERNPCQATVPAISDDQWIKEHAFWVTKNGDLAHNPNHAEPHYLADDPIYNP